MSNIHGNSTYKPEFCQEAIDFLGAGKSVVQFAKYKGVCRATVYNWMDAHPEFKEAMDMAQEWSQAHWEDELVNMMYSKEVNAPLVKLYFANRFKWHDRAEVSLDDEKALPLDIRFEVAQPVGDVQVTNGKAK